MSTKSFFSRRPKESEDSWLTVSDLMSGLMIFFLFIAIVYIQPLQKQQLNIEEIVDTWKRGETAIYEALDGEFGDDLKKWNADLDPKGLSIRFKSPEVLFAPGSAELRPEFQGILADFFPRYLKTLEPFVRDGLVEEIRIEGHTSSDWFGVTDRNAYYLNMQLSQDRTRAALRYSLELPASLPYIDWARPLLTANGLSSAKPVFDATASREDRPASRRVEFRLRTTTQERLNQILEQLQRR